MRHTRTMLALLVFTLCDPQLVRWGSGLDLWVLVDQSSSAESAITAHEAEMEGLLTRSKGSGDNIHFLDDIVLNARLGNADLAA